VETPKVNDRFAKKIDGRVYYVESVTPDDDGVEIYLQSVDDPELCLRVDIDELESEYLSLLSGAKPGAYAIPAKEVYNEYLIPILRPQYSAMTMRRLTTMPDLFSRPDLTKTTYTINTLSTMVYVARVKMGDDSAYIANRTENNLRYEILRWFAARGVTKDGWDSFWEWYTADSPDHVDIDITEAPIKIGA
jgi:hypothetical protein